jgi:hypothetical protein
MQGIEHIVLALTPAERWSAAQQVNVASRTEYGLMLGAGVALVVLLVLLVWVSYRRWVQSQQRRRELFTEDAMRRGLSARECEVLLAIADRSGLRHPRDILVREDAFDRGMARLLAECARTRTPQENEQLKVEIAEVREKLGYLIALPCGEKAGQDALSSWDIAADRVLMVFGLTDAVGRAGGQDHAPRLERTVAAVGRVRRCQRTGRGLSIAVELSDLSDAETDDLIHMVNQACAGADDRGDGDAPQASGTGRRVKTAMPQS